MRKFNMPINVSLNPEFKESVLSKANSLKIKGQEALVQVDEFRDLRAEEKQAKTEWRETLSLLAESKEGTQE